VPVISLQANPAVNFFLLNYTGLHVLKLIDYHNRYNSLPEQYKNFRTFFHSFDHLYTTNVTKCLPRGTCTLPTSVILRKTLTGTAYGLLATALLALNWNLAWWKVSPVVDYITLGLEYYLLLMFVTTMLIAVYRLLGYEVAEFFNRPSYSLSPREFWGRWNLPMQEWLAYNVFNQVAGRRRLYTGVLLTFIVSGLIHEYAVSLASCTINGFLLTYFMIQSFACLLSIHLRRRPPRFLVNYTGAKGLKIAQWALTMACLVIPGILFIYNLKKVFPFNEF
jgi:D-alanyl-lipoteichoic acid acyltransferase DltB (MBOAT superfamily)